MSDTPQNVSPTEFVDARLEEPKPSRLGLWLWNRWQASTLRAVILKLLGLDAEIYFREQVLRNTTNVTKVLQHQRRHIVSLESRIANLESKAGVKKSKILTLDAS